MKHALLITIPLFALAGCNGPVGPDSIPDPQRAPLPFTVPMDPGAISCAQLSNPTALNVATEWALGQARAAALSGAGAAVPDATVLSQNLSTYCRANSDDNLRTAARQVGV